MNSIKDRITLLRNELPENCTLVAVSKTKPNELIQEAYDSGHRDFGENKVQELVEKAGALPTDIHWHMIGHLQRNKVKYIAPFVHLIHGVDTVRLLKEINKQGAKYNRILDCLLQVHIADEETKFGFGADELHALFSGEELKELQHVRITGLMGMATNTEDQGKVSGEFRFLKDLFDTIRNTYDHPNVDLHTLSMGMSGDYPLAINEGSNMVRIGSAIFGKRG